MQSLDENEVKPKTYVGISTGFTPSPSGGSVERKEVFVSLMVDDTGEEPVIRWVGCPKLDSSEVMIRPRDTLKSWISEHTGLNLEDHQGIMFDKMTGGLLTIDLEDSISLIEM